MEPRNLRIGTRRSRLALAQTQLVVDLIKRRFPEIELEIVEISSRGDEAPDAPILPGMGAGVFTSMIQTALLSGEIHLAVHSLKDLPVGEPAGLILAATPARDDPLDALVSREGLALAELPLRSRVGTSSPRRAAQLKLARPDLIVEQIRGNVETRLGKVEAGVFDATVLAAAGVIRLGLEARITERLRPPAFLPAPGQGALAIEARSEDRVVLAIAKALDDLAVRACVTAERAFLAGLGGGCLLAAGALAETRGQTVVLQAGLYGARAHTLVIERPSADAAQLGAAAAKRMLEGAPVGP